MNERREAYKLPNENIMMILNFFFPLIRCFISSEIGRTRIMISVRTVMAPETKARILAFTHLCGTIGLQIPPTSISNGELVRQVEKRTDGSALEDGGNAQG